MIIVHFDPPEAFLDAFFQEGRLGGFFVAGHTGLPVGKALPVEVTFPDEKSFRVRCRVAWRRVAASRGLPAGVGLEFLSTQRHVRELLLAYAEGREIPFESRPLRVPVELEVKARTPAGRLCDVTEDLSEDGCFLRTSAEMDPGTEVVLTLKPPGRLLGVTLRGEIARRVEGPGSGVGIRFVFGSEGERERIRKLVHRLSIVVDDRRAG